MNPSEIASGYSTAINVDQRQVCIIADSDDNKGFLGTGFLFLRNNWIITADHVIKEDSVIRKKLFAIFPAKENAVSTLSLIAHSKELDVAILRINENIIEQVTPLFPADHKSSKCKIFYCFGYDRKTLNIAASVGLLKNSYVRERFNSDELILELKNDNIVGGASGGPILNLSGSVAAMMINTFVDQDSKISGVRATAMHNVIGSLDIVLKSDQWIIL